MGGGGVLRAAAKVAGATAANAGFRTVTAEYPVYSSAGKVARPVSISTISSSSDDVKATVQSGPVSASSASWELDDWEIATVEDEVNVVSGERLPRVVFGGAPSLQEAQEATSDLKDALDKVYLSQPGNNYGGSHEVGQHSRLFPFSNPFELKTKIISETAVTPSVPKHAMQAFKFLNESPAAQTVVASIASDPNVWDAVLQNSALQDFLQSRKSSEDVEESVADAAMFCPPSPSVEDVLSEEEEEEEEESKPNPFTGFLENIKVSVVDMMSSLSDYFQNLFGGYDVSANGDGSAKVTSVVDKTLGASLMGLAVMVIMVVVMKRA